MKRMWIATLAFIACAVVLSVVIGVAATKQYQFTGTVKSVEGTTLTVEKSAKETWTFDTSKDTKGMPKVGDRVTVYYKMLATEIESKPAAGAAGAGTPTKKK